MHKYCQKKLIGKVYHLMEKGLSIICSIKENESDIQASIVTNDCVGKRELSTHTTKSVCW